MKSSAAQEFNTTNLLNELIGATTFEKASALALRAALDSAASALMRSEYMSSGRLERAMVHLRPGGSYRHLVVMGWGDQTVSVPTDRGQGLFSSTAWQWVIQQRHPICIDVTLGRLSRDASEVDQGGIVGISIATSDFLTGKSQARLIDRNVTHLLAVPIRSARGAVDGMISVEANCRAAIGSPFVWSACADAIQRIADLAAPYLTGLPVAPVSPPPADRYLPVIGNSMAAIIELLQVFARQSEPILIGGPTGSGKSRLARWCHEQSPLRDKPFEALDLCAVPEELQMAELFGWKRGAFTGAVRDNVGLIAQAKGGTLFIDEIGNLSPRAQAGLLHVFEERTYRVLGDGGAEKEADVRFLVGTNENLQTAVREKRFREDLYYRINVLPVSLPPLCERQDEIPLWAHHMLNRRVTKHGSPVMAEISPEGQAALKREPWPGNLRQLDNIVRRAYAVALMSFDRVSSEPLVLTEDHIKRAIAYESPVRSSESFHILQTAAAAFVNHAIDRSGLPPLDLDLVDGFKGLVLASALEKLGGNLDDVFRLFGREKLVTSRNHHKAFRREIERAQQLHAVLDPTTAFPFASFLDRSGAGGGEGED